MTSIQSLRAKNFGTKARGEHCCRILLRERAMLREQDGVTGMRRGGRESGEEKDGRERRKEGKRSEKKLENVETQRPTFHYSVIRPSALFSFPFPFGRNKTEITRDPFYRNIRVLHETLITTVCCFLFHP